MKSIKYKKKKKIWKIVEENMTSNEYKSGVVKKKSFFFDYDGKFII